MLHSRRTVRHARTHFGARAHFGCKHPAESGGKPPHSKSRNRQHGRISRGHAATQYSAAPIIVKPNRIGGAMAMESAVIGGAVEAVVIGGGMETVVGGGGTRAVTFAVIFFHRMCVSEISLFIVLVDAT